MKNKSIAIIGTGIAAAWLAHKLQKNGYHLNVFDKARGLGGRTSSRRVSFIGQEFHLDLGAQLVKAQDQSFEQFILAMCKQGICEQWQEAQTYVPYPSMSSLVKHLLKDIELSLQVKVFKATQMEDRRVKLLGQDESELGAYDLVISTAPPLQSSEIFRGFDLIKQFENIKMNPQFAVAIMTEHNYDFQFTEKLISHPILERIVINSHKPARKQPLAIVVHTNSQWTKNNLEISKEDLYRQTLLALKDTTGFEPSENNTLLISHLWLMSKVENPLGQNYLWDKDKGIAVCGDWLLGHDVESAWLSANRLANEIMGT